MLASRNKNSEYSKLINKLKKSKPKDLDSSVKYEHDIAFESVDCLSCANCCKTTSPMLFQADVQRIAKYLKIKTSIFLDKYTYNDEDGDLIFNRSPCPFLGSDNYCDIYDARPKACKEYPHTN